MGDNTKIEWAKTSWSPVTGCTPISAGCLNCYAKRISNRFRGRFGYPKDDPFRPTFHPDRINEPDKWKKPRRVFVCSMGDLFHWDITDKQIGRVWLKAFNDSRHQWIFLTKRIARMRLWSINTAKKKRWTEEDLWPKWIWVCATIENQKAYKERINFLSEIPAAIRGVSLEPLLGPVDLSPWIHKLQWVVVGAETGPRKRAMSLDWARSIRDQCLEARVPFFFKKDSSGNRELDGQLWEQYPWRPI